MAEMDWDAVQNEVSATNRMVAVLSPLTVAIFLSAGAWLRLRWYWSVSGDEPSDIEFDEIETALGQAEYELMSGMVGMIIPNVLSNYDDIDILPCDGASYLRVDYPELYAVLHANYIIDTDNFSVPDLRERVPVGVGGAYSVADNGGASDHTLTEGEMPPHTHGYNYPNFTVSIKTLGTPNIESGTNPPIPLLTTATGGGAAHNNMQPFEVIKFGIVAK